GGPANAAEFLYPEGVAVDAMGNLYIADTGNHRIRKVTPDGVIKTVVGRGSFEPGFSGDGGAATSASLRGPASVAVDAAGDLYIADRGNNRIRKVTLDGVISTIAGRESRQFADGGDDGPATEADIFNPWSVAEDVAGNLYIGVFNGRIRKVT